MIFSISKYFKIAFISVIALIIGFGVLYTKTHTIISNKDLNKKTDSIKDLKVAIIEKDSLNFSLQQTVDLNAKLTQERQIVLSDLNRQLTEAKNEAKRLDEALTHYESNGLIRYFKKECLSRCYVEVFEKPNCIKTK